MLFPTQAGLTPIHLATRSCRMEIVQILILRRANVNICCKVRYHRHLKEEYSLFIKIPQILCILAKMYSNDGFDVVSMCWIWVF